MATPVGGLSDAEAESRLRRDGLNRLPPPKHKTFAAALVSVALQPMVLLLFSCTLLYALLGSVLDSIVLALSIVSVAAISVYQELRTQRVIEALRDLASPRSSVVRGGVVKRISSQELVEGDRLIVLEGDRLACDARLVEAHGLRVDESLLTGESVPVDKGIEGSDVEACLLHAGTLVVQGDGVGEVIATGVRTTLGRIGGTLASIEPRPSRLHGTRGSAVDAQEEHDPDGLDDDLRALREAAGDDVGAHMLLAQQRVAGRRQEHGSEQVPLDLEGPVRAQVEVLAHRGVHGTDEHCRQDEPRHPSTDALTRARPPARRPRCRQRTGTSNAPFLVRGIPEFRG